MNKFEHRPGDQYEIVPSGSEDRHRFRHWRDGRCIGTGDASRGAAAMKPGAEVFDLGAPDARGRRPVNSHFVINSQGSVSSGPATPEYRNGWDRIFAKPGKPTTAKAN